MQKEKKSINFEKIKSNINLPNLIEIQSKSYDWFLQASAPKNKRKKQGLQAVSPASEIREAQADQSS